MCGGGPWKDRGTCLWLICIPVFTVSYADVSVFE